MSYDENVVYSFRMPVKLWQDFLKKVEREGYVSAAEALRSLIRGYVYGEGEKIRGKDA